MTETPPASSKALATDGVSGRWGLCARWRRYFREPFPLVVHVHVPVMAIFSGASVAYAWAERAEPGSTSLAAPAVAFLVALLLFLQLRILDEFKDYDDDRRYRPYRPVAEQVTDNAGARLRDALLAARSMGALTLAILALPRSRERFLARLHGTLGLARPDLSGKRPDELVAYYRDLESRILTHWGPPIMNDFATMVLHGLLRRPTSDWAADGGEGTLANALLGSGRGMRSGEPAIHVRAMAWLGASDLVLVETLRTASARRTREAVRGHPDLEREVQCYLARFGDSCMAELKVESSTRHDDPTPLLSAVGQYARSVTGDGSEERPAAGPARSSCAEGMWWRAISAALATGISRSAARPTRAISWRSRERSRGRGRTRWSR